MTGFLLLVLALASLHTPTLASWERKLTVKIKNIKDTKGDLKISVQSDEKLFATLEGIKDGNNRITDVHAPQTTYIFNKLRKGRYAVAVFQDLNKNNKLDLDLFDKPLEPYGFSQNPQIQNGRPEFKKCVFDFETDKTITIEMIHP